MKFIVWGDSKGKENGINKKALNSVLKEAKKVLPSPEFMVMCGDTVAGGNDEEKLILQLMDLKEIIDKYYIDIELIPVIGNHEVNIEPIDDRFEKVIENFYYKLKPEGVLENFNKSVYYKDFDNTRIIVLNSFRPNETHKVGKEQIAWMKEIASNCNKNKILFVHSPAYPTGAHLGHCLDLYPQDRDDFWEAVEKCDIDLVICGHEHNYSRRLIKSSYNNKDIYQIISCGAGEKLKNKYHSKSGVVVAPIAVYHFLIINVDKSSIKLCAITNKGRKIDEFIIDTNK